MTERLDGRYVHKRLERNVLIARLERRAGESDTYEAEMVVDRDHPFFFEHPLDHVPAMMLLEAGRQLGIAISHLHLGVPMGYMFATESFDIRFTDFANPDAPIIILAAVSDRRYRHGILNHLKAQATYFQGGRSIGGMEGSWVMLPPTVWHRYRRRQHAQLAESCAT